MEILDKEIMMWRKIVFISLVLLFGLVHATGASPDDIRNLVLWLDASDVDGDGRTNDNPANGAAITMWADKSGNGNNAAGGTAPSYSTRAIHGKAAVHFGSRRYLVGQNGFGANITATVFIVGVLYSEAGGVLENIVFYNNLAYDNDTWGIRVNVWHDDSILKHGKVINNTFYNNNNGGIYRR